jgi:hypothetical protein
VIHEPPGDELEAAELIGVAPVERVGTVHRFT